MKETGASVVVACTMQSPVGELHLAASGEGLRGVRWQTHGPGVVLGDLKRQRDQDEGAARDVLARAEQQLCEYFGGTRRAFDLPLDLWGTPFQLSVWRALQSIPFGETWSYAALAARLGQPGAARAVGAANGANPVGIIVPCHRVVGSSGRLTGFAGGLEAKRFLLALEGQGTLLFAEG